MLRRALNRCVLNGAPLGVQFSNGETLISLKSRFFNDDVASAMGSVAPPTSFDPPGGGGGIQGQSAADEADWGSAMVSPPPEVGEIAEHYSDVNIPPMFAPEKYDAKMLEDDPSEEMVDMYLGSECKSSAEKWKDCQQQARHDFKRHETDSGSSEVQVAILTERIKQMQDHLTVHRKDFSSRRGLERMLNTRRKLLIYLRKKDFDKYCVTIGRLNLKDIYVRQDRYAIYRTAKELQRKKLN